jgi:murein DD-endopeptidase MepM/ murein hydrolase activator NlpD
MPSPIKGKLPSTPYKKLGRRWSKGYHTGLDYAVPTGTDVHAIADGTIVRANWGRSYGVQLVCAINGGWIIYAHLSATLVKPGKKLRLARSLPSLAIQATRLAHIYTLNYAITLDGV